MIIVGKRQSGKTTYAINQIISRCKDGDVVGVISYNYESSKFLEKLLKRRVKGVTIKIIDLSEIKEVNHVLIDNLDLVLGDKSICAVSNDVVNIISDTYIDSETAYKEVYNKKK